MFDEVTWHSFVYLQKYSFSFPWPFVCYTSSVHGPPIRHGPPTENHYYGLSPYPCTSVPSNTNFPLISLFLPRHLLTLPFLFYTFSLLLLLPLTLNLILFQPLLLFQLVFFLLLLLLLSLTLVPHIRVHSFPDTLSLSPTLPNFLRVAFMSSHSPTSNIKKKEK